MTVDVHRFLHSVLFQILPAVLPNDQRERRERRIVLGRIGGDKLAGKLRLQKIERRFRHVGTGHELRVDGVGDGVDADCDEGAILVLVRLIDHFPARRLERHHSSRFLPSGEVFDGLQDCDIRLDLAGCELGIDLLVEHGAKAPCEIHRYAWKCLLELLDPTVVGGGWAAP